MLIRIIKMSLLDGKSWSPEAFCSFSQKELDEWDEKKYTEVDIFKQNYYLLPKEISGFKKSEILKSNDSIAQIYFIRNFKKILKEKIDKEAVEQERRNNIYNNLNK